MTRSIKPASKTVLSERQEQILMLVAQGKTYAQISKQLDISVGGVYQTMRIAMNKFNCANSAQLIYRYYAEQFLGPLSRKAVIAKVQDMKEKTNAKNGLTIGFQYCNGP